jgi:iron-sulfur cluster assembly accessory protein
MSEHPVTFSTAAVSHIEKMLAQTPDAKGFRLAVKKTGCSGFSYVPEITVAPQADDITYMVENTLTVFVEKNSLPYLNQLQVDFVVDEAQGIKQKRLVFINPNEKARCGCGESFTIE